MLHMCVHTWLAENVKGFVIPHTYPALASLHRTLAYIYIHTHTLSCIHTHTYTVIYSYTHTNVTAKHQSINTRTHTYHTLYIIHHTSYIIHICAHPHILTSRAEDVRSPAGPLLGGRRSLRACVPRAAPRQGHVAAALVAVSAAVRRR
jgi:hypothetical protein